MLTLISKAYTTIRLSDLVILLGQKEEEVFTKLTSLGWNFDAATSFVTPLRITSATDETSASFDQLMTKLTEYVAFLEN